MNTTHLKTVVWLRWRLAANQLRRSGPGGAAVSVIFSILMAAGGVVMLLVGFLVGWLALRTGSSRAVMVIWDGAIVGFVLFSMAGLISELQRADAMSLDRFLHLPVSPGGVFLINYLGSSVSLGLVLMLPAMIGLAAGLVLSRGPAMLVMFPLVAAFFLMMTALMYQFRGWLASMMENPRRRRTIATVVPVLFILAFQVPNVWNQLGPGARERRAERAEERRSRQALDRELAAGRITREEYNRRRPAPPPENANGAYDTTRLVNAIVPPGWLAYGAEAAVEGRLLPPLAGFVGMGLIGALSLRRAYGTTLRMYRGDFNKGLRPTAPAAAVPAGRAAPARPSTAIVEARIPWTSERVSAVALAGLRSWTRAPEMKMTLLTPVIMLVVFTGMFAGQRGGAAEILRPLSTVGMAAFMLILGMIGPVGNQFGYDRGAFRSFVLSPIPRRDLLLGKNLSLLPFAIVTMVPAVGLSHWSNPMRLDHLLGVLCHLVSLYLMFCLAANLLSIVGPMALKPGSGMPAPHQGIRSVYPLVFMLVAPLPLGLTLIPLGIEALLWGLDWYAWLPVYLVLGLVQAGVMVWLYRRVLVWEGDLLQRREQRILEIVGAKAE